MTQTSNTFHSNQNASNLVIYRIYYPTFWLAYLFGAFRRWNRWLFFFLVITYYLLTLRDKYGDIFVLSTCIQFSVHDSSVYFKMTNFVREPVLVRYCFFAIFICSLCFYAFFLVHIFCQILPFMPDRFSGWVKVSF